MLPRAHASLETYPERRYSPYERPPSEDVESPVIPVKAEDDDPLNICQYLRDRFNIRDSPAVTQETHDSLPVEIRKRFKPDMSFSTEENVCLKCERKKPDCVCSMKDERLYGW